MKKSLIIIIAVAIFAGLLVLVLRSRRDEPAEMVGASVSDPARGPVFEVRVVVPRTGLPFGGILPDWLVKKHDLTPREMRFDHTSRGAQFGSIAHDLVEFRADGWDLLIETGGKGAVAPGTRLVFHMGLGGNKLTLRCRPGDPASGYLSTTTQAGSDKLDGSFLVKLATCENAESGKTINWPPAPLTLSGSFAGLPHGRR